MSETMMKNYANRLGVEDDETFRKSLELHRLIKLNNQFNVPESLKMVLSIDCASKLCATGVDDAEILKVLKMKKTEYAKQKQTFEKLLNLTKKLQLNEICAQFGFSEVIKNDAITLLAEYGKRMKFSDDTDSPHCITMAIYQAWKQRKLKGGTEVKRNLLSLSKLNSCKWKSFEADWDKWIEQDSPLVRKIVKAKTTNDSATDADEHTATEDKENAKAGNDIEMEPYEQWRDRMIATAKVELAKGNTHKKNV